MVVVQLVEQLLPKPEVRGLNPVISKIYIEHLITVNCNEKTKIKKKEAWNGPFLKNGKDLRIEPKIENIYFENRTLKRSFLHFSHLVQCS